MPMRHRLPLHIQMNIPLKRHHLGPLAMLVIVLLLLMLFAASVRGQPAQGHWALAEEHPIVNDNPPVFCNYGEGVIQSGFADLTTYVPATCDGSGRDPSGEFGYQFFWTPPPQTLNPNEIVQLSLRVVAKADTVGTSSSGVIVLDYGIHLSRNRPTAGLASAPAGSPVPGELVVEVEGFEHIVGLSERFAIYVEVFQNSGFSGGVTGMEYRYIYDWVPDSDLPPPEPPPPDGNHAPTVALNYRPLQPSPEDTMEFQAEASDPDGDPLRYTWYVDGAQQSAQSDNVTWKQPPQGAHTVRVVVADDRGGQAEHSVTFTVGVSQNRSPVVRLSVTPASPTTADTVELHASASDPDGDPLIYMWYVDGDLQSTQSDTVTWTQPEAGAHTVRVEVSDDKDGQAQDTVTFTVNAAAKRYVVAPGFQENEDPIAFVEQVTVDGQPDPDPADTQLHAGARLITGPGVEIMVRFGAGAVVRVGENSEYEFQERKLGGDGISTVLMRLKEGICEFYWPTGHAGAERYEVATERVVTGILGTRLTVSHRNGVTTVSVQEGEATVTDPTRGATRTVSAGQTFSSETGSDGESIEAALDVNGNGVLDDAEIRQAIQYWILGQPVPGTGQTINDVKILTLIQIWILGQPVSGGAPAGGARPPT